MGVTVLVLVLFVWVLILTLFLGWIFRYFRHLTKGVDKENLLAVLENVLKTQGEVLESLRAVQKRIKIGEIEEKLHIQKIGIERFNPFKEMGGDHSFSLALLDGTDTGFIITGLHTRERTRVYIKIVQRGKSVAELSSEEKKALVSAQKS
jgi:hypothetical protein